MYYCFVGLAKNEFTGLTLRKCNPQINVCSGTGALAAYGFNTGTPSIGLCIILLCVIYLALIVTAFLVLLYQTRTRYRRTMRRKKHDGKKKKL